MKDIKLLLSGTSARILAVAGLNYSWVMVFFEDSRVWLSDQMPGVATDTWMTAYMVGACVSIVVACFIVHPSQAAGVTRAATILAAASLGAYYLTSNTMIAACAAVTLGISAGMLMAAGMLLIIFCLPPGGRALPLALTLLFYYCVTAGLSSIYSAWGLEWFLFTCGVVMMMTLGLTRFPLHQACVTPEMSKPPSKSLYFAVFSIISMNYFAFYLVNSTHFLNNHDLVWLDPWISWAVRALFAIAFILFLRTCNIVKLMYALMVLQTLTFSLGLFGTSGRVIGTLVHDLQYALADIVIGSLIMDLSLKYRRNKLILPGFLALIGISLLSGWGVGLLVSNAVSDSAPAIYGILLAGLCLILLILPKVLTVFDQELSPIIGSPERSEDGTIRNISYARLNPDKAISILSGHYDGPYKLSPREREVAILLLDRYDYETIATLLGISVNTLKVHIRSIYKKCDVSSRKELILLVAQLV